MKGADVVKAVVLLLLLPRIASVFGRGGAPAAFSAALWPYTLPRDRRRWSLEGLHPDARPHFAMLIEHARELGFEPRIADGTRSPEEQWRERQSKSSKVDCSWHLGGRALDVDLHGLGPGKFSPDYAVLGEWWQAHGGQWGGTFTEYGEHGDFRHFEWAPGLGYPKQHGLCDSDPSGVARYWGSLQGAQ